MCEEYFLALLRVQSSPRVSEAVEKTVHLLLYGRCYGSWEGSGLGPGPVHYCTQCPVFRYRCTDVYTYVQMYICTDIEIYR